ncbi:HAD family hydrolase [Halalkalicoccus tibetensis]|uniref:HAD family hydrolase n=1 Tax=Halalkalicoccus tibetensis TaxID=175632 RepID=A0ABD5V4G2_9EURY
MNADAVFFDIGGVILDSGSVRRAHERFVADLGDEYDLDAESALGTWRAELGAHFREREGTEFRSARAGYERAIDALGVDGEWEPLFERAIEGAIEPNPGAVEAVETLAGRDLHLGVISDVDDAEGRRILETFGILETFDSVTTSEAVGRTKPDPAMFETALGKSGTDPERSLMVGDRYRHDIEGAKDVGMVTAAYGTEEGPAVDHCLDDLRDVLELV